MSMKIVHSPNHRYNVSFSDYFQQQNRNILLLTHYREEHSYYELINSKILEKLIGLDLQSVPYSNLKECLTSFFLDLNWELNAHFRSTTGFETGASLLLVITEGNNICYVSCGRFLCVTITKDNCREIGASWTNHHVKTKEELALVGNLEKDYLARPEFLTITDGMQFIACSSDCTTQVNPHNLNIFNSQSMFEDAFKVHPCSYCIVEYVVSTIKHKRPWYKAKRFRFTITIMFLMLALSVYYNFKGDNRVEDRLHIIREQFQLEVRNIDVLKIQEMFPLDYGILFVPRRNIELFVEWESTLPFDVTSVPNFDLRQIFLASGNKLYAYDKRDKKNNWTVTFNGKIAATEILDANLLIVTTVTNETVCIKRDSGDIVWQRKGSSVPYQQGSKEYQPVQISLEMDRRLNNSIVLIPDRRSLTLFNILNGDTLYYYEAESNIQYLSDFDLIEKSVYMVKQNRLYKIRFDIKT